MIKNMKSICLLFLVTLLGCGSLRNISETLPYYAINGFIKDKNHNLVLRYDNLGFVKDIEGNLVYTYNLGFIKDINGNLKYTYAMGFVKDTNGEVVCTYKE